MVYKSDLPFDRYIKTYRINDFQVGSLLVDSAAEYPSPAAIA